ncbi:hypothetical protein PRIC1_014397 [Phytophthora ramorum]
MDAQPAVFSGTLKVRACHVLWAKTPVQLTYHRQDYRHALPVLLIRRSGLLGGEFCVPLDPCVHPVRFLPTSERMASKLEFALEYGWHTKHVRLRAPDANTYRQWTSLVTAALESGRRPLPSCCDEQPRQDLACSSLASTLNSSNNSSATFNATIRRRVPEEEAATHFNEHDLGLDWQHPSDFFVLHHTDYQPDAVLWQEEDSFVPSLASPSSAVVGSCHCEDSKRDVHLTQANRCFWRSPYIPIESRAVIHQLFLQTRFLFFLL